MLEVHADAYSFEAANVRHEHEWKLWKDVKLPDGKVLMPGVVTHSTNLIEHPEIVADRIVRWAETVGRDKVVASTDCGLGGRVHPQIAWAKLEALRAGRRARLAAAVVLSASTTCAPRPPPARRAQRLNASIRTAVMADNRHGRPRAGHRSSFRRKTWMRATSARMTVESRCVHSYSRHGRAPPLENR